MSQRGRTQKDRTREEEEEFQRLFMSAIDDDPAEIARVAASGRFDFNGLHYKYDTALLFAIRNDRDSAFEALVPLSDVNTRSRFGLTALYAAAEGGQARYVRVLAPLSDEKVRLEALMQAIGSGCAFSDPGGAECVIALLPHTAATPRELTSVLQRILDEWVADWAFDQEPLFAQAIDHVAADPRMPEDQRAIAIERVEARLGAGHMPRTLAAIEQEVLRRIAADARACAEVGAGAAIADRGASQDGGESPASTQVSSSLAQSAPSSVPDRAKPSARGAARRI